MSVNWSKANERQQREWRSIQEISLNLQLDLLHLFGGIPQLLRLLNVFVVIVNSMGQKRID